MSSTTTAELFARCRELVDKGKLPNGDTPVVVATAGKEGDPDARYVLLKEIDDQGFVFYTNLKSAKGRQIAERPRATLVFYWPALGTQLRATGRVVEVDAAQADAYWKTRARDSRLASMASEQSATLGDRTALLKRLEELTNEYGGKKEIPRPAHWTGLRVVPERIEIWTGREHRLHERVLWTRKGDTWTSGLLQP
jgi:pyridoxamine 5'-phosphate oxidase